MLALFGPTAAGKSTLAHAAALALGGELVVADPFQRYRGLEIAADSPRAARLAEVPHHGVGDLALSQGSTAAGFARLAHAAIDAAIAAGRVPVVSGGTGLYLRSALADLDFPEGPEPGLREWSERLAESDPEGAMRALRARDPEAAERIDRANPRRVARALQVAAGDDRRRPAPDGPGLWSERVRWPTLLVGVTRPREVLDRRIAERVRRELDEGLVAEIEAALDAPDLSREAAQVIGVREVRAIRAGELDAGELPERLVARTRRLARKQLTWMRKTPGVVLLDLGDAPVRDGLPRLLALWRGAGAAGGIG